MKSLSLQEYIPLGQRVEGYTIECRMNGAWEPVFSGRKMGFKRIILAGRAPAVEKRCSDARHIGGDGSFYHENQWDKP